MPVGTADKVAERRRRARAQFPFHVVSNPEFLKEGAAVDDFMKPDRVVLGAETDHARSVMAELYAPFVRTGKPIIFMDIASAEMTKYAANAMLATRISFMNDIANLCERVGANVDMVRRASASDERIGPAFLFPGPGLRRLVLPQGREGARRRPRASNRDVPAHSRGRRGGQRRPEAPAVREADSSCSAASVAGARIAVWGLAFKPNTDDMREAPALTLIEELLGAGATVVAHDPVAMDEARAPARRLASSSRRRATRRSTVPTRSSS